VPNNGTCEHDRRGNAKGRVCLEERPHHVYYVEAVTHYNNGSMKHPPGLDHFLEEGGFQGVDMEDVVRSSLFRDEVWRAHFMNEDMPDLQTILEESMTELPSAAKRDVFIDEHTRLLKSAFVERDTSLLSSIGVDSDRHTDLLLHYGEVTGAILLPICRSWYGEAITNIDSGDHTNAPCLCDPPARYMAAHWGSTTNNTDAYTERFIIDGEFQSLGEYGKMCRNHNGCGKHGKWAPRLAVEEQDLNKEMRDAWTTCNNPYAHGNNDPLPSSSTEAESVSDTSTKSQPPVLSPATKGLEIATTITTAASSTMSGPVIATDIYALGGWPDGGWATTVYVRGELVFSGSKVVDTVSNSHETVSRSYYTDGEGVTHLSVTTITFATPAPTA
jgi:hypothetical protein